ncbi:protein of unknown function [Kyrpidia spormannii]|uniref:Uncharacterized protein n=2 Tax=Kyrpidia spormannii TaxID=2055160 RepID=A0ACA8Z7A8_9BACL|nr:protein of unknown function [Kyrpidia spormannii]CAB3391687.1 protein of unknown function [Kyrpidia spormannii]
MSVRILWVSGPFAFRQGYSRAGGLRKTAPIRRLFHIPSPALKHSRSQSLIFTSPAKMSHNTYNASPGVLGSGPKGSAARG